MMSEEERRAGDDARQAAAIIERKRAALQTELEDVRPLLEAVRLTLTLPFMYLYLIDTLVSSPS